MGLNFNKFLINCRLVTHNNSDMNLIFLPFLQAKQMYVQNPKQYSTFKTQTCNNIIHGFYINQNVIFKIICL